MTSRFWLPPLPHEGGLLLPDPLKLEHRFHPAKAALLPGGLFANYGEHGAYPLTDVGRRSC